MGDFDICRELDWDSKFFGRRIARVNADRLDARLADDVVAWGRRHDIDCLYFLADADDPESARLAEAHGFRQVDVRLTLERRLDSAPKALEDIRNIVVRLAAANDGPALRSLARVSHRDSRFYHDPRFSASRCDDLYEIWIDKGLNGFADAVLVVDDGGTAVGYASCRLADGDEGTIELFAVSATHQGRGVGGTLLAASLGWFAARNRRHITVVTQGRNARAQRLYEAGGFTRHLVQIWYHRWFE